MAVLGLMGMLDMPIPDRFEINRSKEMVSGVIFGVEHLVLTRKTKMLGKLVLLGCMCGALCSILGL